MLTAVSGAMFLREPQSPMILNIRKGYHAKIRALLHYLVDENGHKRIAALLEGYFVAMMVASIFEKLGPNFSKSSFIKALGDIPKEVFKDRSIVIKDNNCGCLNNVYITKYRAGEFKVVGTYSHE